MDGRLDRLQPAQQGRVVVEGQVRVQAVDHVHLGDGLVGADAQLVQGLLERQRVGVGVAGHQPRKRAEQAVGHADVGGLQPDVVIVERQAAVATLALAVGEPPQGQRVGALEQADAVLERQPSALVELLLDVQQARPRDPCLSQPHNPSIVACYTPRWQQTPRSVDQGSWVRSPHGPATVCGERARSRLPLCGGPSRRSNTLEDETRA